MKKPVLVSWASPLARVLAYSLVFLGAMAVSVFSDDTRYLVLHRFVSGEPDNQIEEMLYLAAGITLSGAGFSSTRNEGRADYLLAASYAQDGDWLQVRYTFSSYRGSTLAVHNAGILLDYSFDSMVAAAVSFLLNEAEISTDSAETGGITDLFAPESPQNEYVPAGMRFDTLLAAGGLMFFGDSTRYFRYGISASLSAGFTWPRRTFSVTWGAKASCLRAVNDRDVSGGPLFITTAGMNLELGKGGLYSGRMFLALSAGAALLTVDPQENAMTKTVPYADIALRTGFPVTRRLYLGADIGFLAVFDDEILIMAASPALSARMEF